MSAIKEQLQEKAKGSNPSSLSALFQLYRDLLASTAFRSSVSAIKIKLRDILLDIRGKVFGSSKTFIFWDGLNDCHPEDLTEILLLVKCLANGGFHCFVTSRSYPMNLVPELNSNAQINLSSPECLKGISQDIEKYLDVKMRESRFLSRMVTIEPELAKSIVREVGRHSKGL